MRVLYLNDVGGRLGGGEYQLLRLAEAASRTGLEPIVACIPNSTLEQSLIVKGIETLSLPELRSNPPAAVRRLKRFILGHAVDLIHTTSFLTNFGGRLAGRAMGLPVVTTVHCEPDSYRAASSGPVRGLTYLARVGVERAMARFSDRFIAVSSAVAEKLIAGGIPAEKVTVISNGIDSEAIRNAALESTAGPADDDRRSELKIATIARLDPVKGIDIFIKAVEDLTDRGVPVTATIIGDGPLRLRLESLVRSLGLEDRVAFAGYLDNPYPLLKRHDVYVVSSLSEGQNLTVLEAMALDLPVVATAVGGIVDMVTNRQSGLLVPPNDPPALAAAIDRIAGDKALCEEIVAAGRLVIERFTIEAMCAKTFDIYRSASIPNISG